MIPEKREDLVAAGYEFTGEGKCRGCGEYIEWWVTPNGKRMPFRVFEEHANGLFANSDKTGFFRRPHWQDCTSADDFRKASAKR